MNVMIASARQISRDRKAWKIKNCGNNRVKETQLFTLRNAESLCSLEMERSLKSAEKRGYNMNI
jgi:hypothetical protein